MRNLLLGVILGLFALVQSTPLNAVTQIPAKAEYDVLQEAITDGFIVESSFLHSTTTESPKHNIYVQQSDGEKHSSDFEASNTQASSDDSDMVDGSGNDSVHEETQTTAVLPTVRFTSTVLQRHSEHLNSSSTQSPQPGSISTSVSSVEEEFFLEGATQSVAQSSLAPSHSSVSQSTEPPVFTTPSTTSQFAISHSPVSESEDEKVLSVTPDMSFSTTSSSSSSLSPSTASVTHQDSVTEQHALSELSTVPSTSTASLSTSRAGGMFTEMEGSGLGMSTENPVENSAEEEAVIQPRAFAPVNSEPTGGPHQGDDLMSPEGQDHTTPDWINRAGGLFTESEGSGLGMSFENPDKDNAGEYDRIVPQGEVIQSKFASVNREAVGGNESMPPQAPGHTTPGWIIIVAFVVAVAALVIICVAIATRDKWNGPSQASQERAETQANASNQQMELEMETFLEKDSPRENGQAAEYTIIPLNELPEKDSSP